VIEGGILDSFARVDDPGVIIETVKVAESGDGIVLRLYESLGHPTTTALRLGRTYASATLTDLIERPIGAADLDRLQFGPFEIKTILLGAS